eukprot:27741_1
MQSSWRSIRITIMHSQFYHSQVKTNRKIDNFQATKLIKDLYFEKLDKQNIIQNALKIFAKIEEPKNNFSINSLLTLFLSHNCTDKIDLIWNDIENLSQNKQTISGCYTLLISCCIKSLDIEKCIQIFSWMEQHNHKLTLPPEHITKLLNETTPTISHLKYIQHLINKHIINTNECIQSALIINYCNHNDISSALNIFNSMTNINNNCLNTILTLMTNNGYNKQALELAQQWIDYYDTFNDITNALNIFKSIQ